MATDLWIELAESMLRILRQIIEAEEVDREVGTYYTMQSEDMVICLDCGCNAKECVCY